MLRFCMATIILMHAHRAEVGLLSHNVIVEGAIDGQREDQYGAQIFIHRMGPHPTPIR